MTGENELFLTCAYHNSKFLPVGGELMINLLPSEQQVSQMAMQPAGIAIGLMQYLLASRKHLAVHHFQNKIKMMCKTNNFHSRIKISLIEHLTTKPENVIF